MTDIGNENQSHFGYSIDLSGVKSNTSCEERGYEAWDYDSYYCFTTFQGKSVL